MSIASLIRALITAAALLLAPHGAQAADTEGAYTFRSYGPEQGLRNQAVTGLTQDREGFIFVGTEDGLFRYDGSRFERFGTSHGLLSDSITGMYREPRGRMWVMNAKGGLAWSGDRPDPQVKAPILPKRRIEAISSSDDGYLLVSTDEGFYEGKPDALALIGPLPRAEGGAVWISPDGKEMLATARGKLHRRLSGGAWSTRDLPPGYRNELIHTLLKDPKGRIWIRGRRVLLQLDAFGGREQDLSDKLPGASVLKGQLVLDAHGKVWTTTNLGLVRFDDDGLWHLGEQQGLPTQWATGMLIDREGNLWVAAEGVHRMQGRLTWTAHTRRQKLPSDTVWAVQRTRDGVMWAGTNRGLARGDGKQWTVLPGTEERSLYALAEDKAGNFWAAGNNAKQSQNAVLLREAGSATFRSIPLSHITGPSSVNTMNIGPDDALYVGTQAHGLHRIARSGAGYVGKPVALPNGPAKEQINQVMRDARGRLWVAGMHGLAYFDGTVWRRFGTMHGLRETHVEALVIDPAGDLLVSYWNIHGLTRFAINDHGLLKATQVDQPAALVADNIYSLGYDKRGALWLGTAQGVKRWQSDKGRLEQFGRGEGLPSDDAAANAFWPDANGDVWFGMASGIARYQASAEQAAPPRPATRVLKLEDGAGRLLAPARPRIHWRDRTLTFRFAVLGFTNEARMRPQVRLVGFEDQWRDTDVREARYTGLPAGDYRFEVRASAGDDNFGPASMREVTILSPWWGTWWAIMLLVAALAGLLFLFMRWRHKRLSRRNAELEALVRARTEALEQANGALHEASMVDPLTGLKNRRFLGLGMPDELARVHRQNSPSDSARDSVNKTLLFFMIDIDHFKAVNDRYGHAAGDHVLREVSAVLRSACRDADFVVRWGGEEFLVVARNSDRAHAGQMATNMLNAVRELRIDVGRGVTLIKTCSIGFAAYPIIEAAPDAYQWEDAVKMADQCLYAAKHTGRDAWVGVVMPADAADPGPRIASDLAGLAAENLVPVSTSLPPTSPIRWQ